uniref:Uncharacterized protein n=1 Tax=Arundo donax TaxID=35708 RepID=A0A0A9BCC2_ARUDO
MIVKSYFQSASLFFVTIFLLLCRHLLWLTN